MSRDNFDGALDDIRTVVVDTAQKHGHIATAAAVGAVFCSTVGALSDCSAPQVVQSYLQSVTKSLDPIGVRARFVVHQAGRSSLSDIFHASLASLFEAWERVIDDHGEVVAEAAVGALICTMVSCMLESGHGDRVDSLLHAVAETLALDGVKAVFVRGGGTV